MTADSKLNVFVSVERMRVRGGLLWWIKLCIFYVDVRIGSTCVLQNVEIGYLVPYFNVDLLNLT